MCTALNLSASTTGTTLLTKMSSTSTSTSKPRANLQPRRLQPPRQLLPLQRIFPAPTDSTSASMERPAASRARTPTGWDFSQMTLMWTWCWTTWITAHGAACVVAGKPCLFEEYGVTSNQCCGEWLSFRSIYISDKQRDQGKRNFAQQLYTFLRSFQSGQ